MRIKIGNGLIPLNLLVGILIVAILFFPSNVLRVVLGIPFLLFFPGYALHTVLFPKREALDGIERVALSFALSIVVVPLIGLILNYLPWGIRLESVLYSVASFILVTSVIAWFRWKRLPEPERFDIKFQVRMTIWAGGVWNKVLSIILVIAILGALGMVAYVIAAPKVGERFTEFYILGLNGRAIDYPRELKLGEEGRVIVGIASREYEIVSYRLEVRIDGVKNSEVEPIVLEHNEKWEEIVSFTPAKAGDREKVEFLLYKNGAAEPYLEPLHLWLKVTE